MEEDIAQKWVCLLCGKYYDKKEDAMACVDMHEFFEYEPRMVIGNDMPLELKVTLYKRNRLFKVIVYKPERNIT